MNRNKGVGVSMPYVQQQAVVPTCANSSTSSPMKRYKNILFSMGIMEIIIGSLSVILGIATVVIAVRNHGYYYTYYYSVESFYDSYRSYYHVFSYSGQGIWSGVFASVVGILGVRAKSNPSKCMYNANMALCIIGALMMGALTILSGIAASTINFRLPSLLAMHSVLTLLGFAGAVIMIIHSAYCCTAVCGKSDQEVAVSYHHSSPTGIQQPQPIPLANSQYVLASTQSINTPYPVTQAPVVGGPVAFQPSSNVIPAPIPTNQSYHIASLGNQLVLVPSTIQTAASGAQPNGIANPQQAASVGKEELKS